jgi:hypothetical protein
VRALNIFRDLSSLAASSNLGSSLEEKLDQSRHFIVLASPQAKTSEGVEFEAKYWFSKPRSGQVVVVVTSGTYKNWREISENALPPSLREHLHSTPLWLDISGRGKEIGKTPRSDLVTSLTEDLHQLILLFYPGRSWGDLRGEERLQRRKTLTLVWLTILILILTTGVAIRMAIDARSEKQQADEQRQRAEEQARTAESRRLAAESVAALTKYPQRSLLLAVEAAKVGQTLHGERVAAAEQSLREALGFIVAD